MDALLDTQARALGGAARQLLQESRLAEFLDPLGEVRLTGAYAYGVMLDPDIDIEVVVPRGRERASALALLQRLIDQDYWNGYLFYDHQEKRSPVHTDLPWAYYLGLKTGRAGLWWKIDLWVGNEEALQPDDEWVRRNMDAEVREAVLRLKQARAGGRLKASGLDIYRAVLRAHVATVQQFLSWQARSGDPRPGERQTTRLATPDDVTMGASCDDGV